MNKEFTHWYYGGIGPFSRGELAHSELVQCSDVNKIDLWLQRAFEAGLAHQQRAQQRPLLISAQERAALLDGGAGWMDSIETK